MAEKVFSEIKAMKRIALGDVDPAFGSVQMSINAKGVVTYSGKTADGFKVSGSTSLVIDDNGYYTCTSMVLYDKNTKKVYDLSYSWEPQIGDGEIVGWWDVGNELMIYEFE